MTAGGPVEESVVPVEWADPPLGEVPVPEAAGVLFAWLEHAGHVWEQVGRCVYCHDCGLRLYQGRIPASHTNVYRRSAGSSSPRATDEMRRRWGKD